jgi:hypothetical protein
MLRRIRFTIARLMGVVLIMALGLAALRTPTEAGAGVMLLFTCGLVMVSLVGAVCRAPAERAWWLGFALFGFGYLAMAHWTSAFDQPLPTIALVDFVVSKLGLTIATGMQTGRQGWEYLSPAARILHCLWALALGLFGCVLAGRVVGAIAEQTPLPAERDRGDRMRSRPWWRHRAAIALSAFWLLMLAAGVGRWPAPGLWAGASFLMACGLLGLAALGAVFSRGRDRGIWMGAALFGFGYLGLTFGKSELFIVSPHLPTEGMLNSVLRPSGPPIISDFPDFTTQRFSRVKNQVIKKKLDQPIPMHFPNETPLDEVLKHIRQSTRDANSPGIPIYVDPVGLQIAERSLSSTVSIDIDPIPVKDALRLCLKQLGLGFTLRQGFIMISDDDSATIPIYEDPMQVVGQSFLALVAAVVGGVAARFVCERTPRAAVEDRAAA